MASSCWKLFFGQRLKIILFLLFLVCRVSGLIVEGHLKTKEDWVFVARFCYRDSVGTVDFRFEYPSKLTCQNATLYYDTQWSKVYPQPTKSCQAKLDETVPDHHQILKLCKTYYCKPETIDGEAKTVCTGQRQFQSTRSRWWYLVFSHCDHPAGVEMKYKMTMLNGNSFWTKHFSADEQRILEPNIFFLIVTFVLLNLGIILAAVLKSRQLFHYTYKLFLWSLLFEVLSLIFDVIYYTDYGKSGRPKRALKVIQRGCHSVADIVLLLTLILIAKGWTVTRGRISSSGQVKLGIFFTLYATGYIAMYIYEAKAFDPGKVLYLYESPAGLGLCIMRVLAWIWFCYGTFFTLKHYPTKYLFYYPFWFFYTMWFLSGPIFVLIATYIIDAWARAQVMNGIDRSVAFAAYTFFMFLTRPSTANKNFPYHVRTTQVGVINSDSADNFTEHPYAPTANGASNKQLSDISAMFSIISSEKVTFDGAGGLSRDADNGKENKLLSNGTPSSTPSSTPPEYAQSAAPNLSLFQASNVGT